MLLSFGMEDPNVAIYVVICAGASLAYSFWNHTLLPKTGDRAWVIRKKPVSAGKGYRYVYQMDQTFKLGRPGDEDEIVAFSEDCLRDHVFWGFSKKHGLHTMEMIGITLKDNRVDLGYPDQHVSLVNYSSNTPLRQDAIPPST